MLSTVFGKVTPLFRELEPPSSPVGKNARGMIVFQPALEEYLTPSTL